jgi:FixJ family two-component response regulator
VLDRFAHARRRAAISRFAAGTVPNCLILDLRMPGMTGVEIQQDLARKGIRIPTIIITAHDEAGIRERCKSAGAIAYLAPVAAGSDGAR